MHPQLTRYVIVGMARSGTTATHVALYGHPQVCAMADEVRVDPFFTRGVACFTVGGKNEWERARSYQPLFDALTRYRPEAPDPEGKRLIAYNGTPQLPKADLLAHGLKVAIPSAEDAQRLVECLQDHFRWAKIIHVRRRDWLAQFASLSRALSTGVWHTSGDKKDPGKAHEPMHLLPQQFEKYLEQCAEIERQLFRLRSSHETLEFRYEEELATDDARRFDRIFEFLGVPAIAPTWLKLTKTAPPLESYVANTAELRTMLDAFARPH